MVQTTNTTTDTSTTNTSSCPYLRPKAEQGWECPRCGRINAPWVRQCDCVRSNWTITCDDQVYRPEWWKVMAQANANTYIGKDKVEVGGSDYWNSVSKTWTNVPDSTYYNQDPSTKTIHNEKSNYKE